MRIISDTHTHTHYGFCTNNHKINVSTSKRMKKNQIKINLFYILYVSNGAEVTVF